MCEMRGYPRWIVAAAAGCLSLTGGAGALGQVRQGDAAMGS